MFSVGNEREVLLSDARPSLDRLPPCSSNCIEYPLSPGWFPSVNILSLLWFGFALKGNLHSLGLSDSRWTSFGNRNRNDLNQRELPPVVSTTHNRNNKNQNKKPFHTQHIYPNKWAYEKKINYIWCEHQKLNN